MKKCSKCSVCGKMYNFNPHFHGHGCTETTFDRATDRAIKEFYGKKIKKENKKGKRINPKKAKIGRGIIEISDLL